MGVRVLSDGRGTAVNTSSTESRVPSSVFAASVVLVVKATLGVWGAYALLSASRLHHRSFLGGTVRARNVSLGLALGVLAVASLVVAVALVRALPSARLGAFILEGVGSVLALARIAHRPASSLTSLALSAVIVGLLLVPGSADVFARGSRAQRRQPHPTSP
jgi:hypothetical protein